MFLGSNVCLKIFRKILAKKRQPGLLSLGNSDALALTALQGAISSCFAKLPEQQAAELAGEAMGTVWQKDFREVVRLMVEKSGYITT